MTGHPRKDPIRLIFPVAGISTIPTKEANMKKVLALAVAMMLLFSSAVYAGGDKNRGSRGQGSTGTDGKGKVSQQRGN